MDQNAKLKQREEENNNLSTILQKYKHFPFGDLQTNCRKQVFKEPVIDGRSRADGSDVWQLN